jgi:thymidylate kinase
MIAYDQRTALVKAYRKATKGTIMLCDRYPSATMGGMDGPRVDASWFSSGYSVKRILAQIEEKLYASIPRPDLVLFLTVPIEVALQRNATRMKKEGTEPDAYVRSRHALMGKWHIPNTSICRIDTNRPLEETLLTVKRIVWDFI